MATESLAELVRFVARRLRLSLGEPRRDVRRHGRRRDPRRRRSGRCNPRTPALIKEAIRSVTAQPVRYVVYSHSAFDHSTGGAVFADTARFVGHRTRVEPHPGRQAIRPRRCRTSSSTSRRPGAGRAACRPLSGRPLADRRLHRRPRSGRPGRDVRRTSCSRATSRSARCSATRSGSSSGCSGSKPRWTSTSSCPVTRRRR